VKYTCDMARTTAAWLPPRRRLGWLGVIAALATACAGVQFTAVSGPQRVPGTAYVYTAPDGWKQAPPGLNSVQLGRGAHRILMAVVAEHPCLSLMTPDSFYSMAYWKEAETKAYPSGMRARIRSLQVDGRPAQRIEVQASGKPVGVAVLALDGNRIVLLEVAAVGGDYERSLSDFEALLTGFRFGEDRMPKPPSAPSAEEIARCAEVCDALDKSGLGVAGPGDGPGSTTSP
jgi:hypothetical protein